MNGERQWPSFLPLPLPLRFPFLLPSLALRLAGRSVRISALRIPIPTGSPPLISTTSWSRYCHRRWMMSPLPCGGVAAWGRWGDREPSAPRRRCRRSCGASARAWTPQRYPVTGGCRRRRRRTTGGAANAGRRKSRRDSGCLRAARDGAAASQTPRQRNRRLDGVLHTHTGLDHCARLIERSKSKKGTVKRWNDLVCGA